MPISPTYDDRQPLTTSVYTIKVIIEINVEPVHIYNNKNCLGRTDRRERVSKNFNNFKQKNKSTPIHFMLFKPLKCEFLKIFFYIHVVIIPTKSQINCYSWALINQSAHVRLHTINLYTAAGVYTLI